jgi:prepilin-type N-terminal cleavage/methylation domain-containing protein/prepilin-type processing-associated H-X9-DG protein
MSRPNRHAVTLVELLVVIAILGTLVAILLPAVLGAREAGRRTKCTNNQKEIASAVNQFELAKKRFPGYLNGTQVLPADQTRGAVSWVVVVFPYLQRQDLWEQWATWRATEPYPVPNPADGRPGPVIGQLVCPDDSGDAHVEPRFTPLSYVANCGLPDTLASSFPLLVDTSASGVFLNAWPRALPQASIKSSDIRDGASLTLLIAENVQATEWFPTNKPGLAARPATEADVGMVWWPASSIPSSNVWINQGRKDLVAVPPSLEYARPSSNHPGGAVVAYCDGRAEFLSEEIDHRVYQMKMAPYDAAVSAWLVPPLPP